MAAKFSFVMCSSVAVANANTKTLTPAENQMLCIDAPGGTAFNGNMLWLWECNGLDNQNWVVGNQQIRYGADESFCIDAREMTNGIQLMLWDCNGLQQQKWVWDSNAKTVYLDGTSTCLDWYEGDTDNGQDLHVWDCNGGGNQQWDLRDTQGPPTPAPPRPPAPAPTTRPPTAATCPNTFFDSCSDLSGGNWPTFSDSSSLQSDSQWSKYFTLVYGEVPSCGYPICLSGFRMLHLEALQSAGMRPNKGYKGHSGDFFEGEEFTGTSVGFIYHDNRQSGQLFGSNQWVEGLHCSTTKETGSAWYYFATGSGVWIWSGKTKAWKSRYEFQSEMGFGTGWFEKGCHGTPEFECGGELFKTAKSQHGYDTIQYTDPIYDQAGNSPMFISTTGVGKHTCGASTTPWKAGWGASTDCNCDQWRDCQNCQGFASPSCARTVVAV